MYLTLTRNLENLTKRQNWCHTINLFFFFFNTVQFWKVIHFYSTVIYSNSTYLPLSSSSLRISNFFSQVSINPRYKWPFLQFLSTVATLSLLQVSVPLKRVWICYLWAEIVFKKKVVMKGNIPHRAHFPSPFHVSLIIWVCPHLSLPALALPYQSLFYIHFIKAASGQKKEKEKKHKTSAEAGVWFLT